MKICSRISIIIVFLSCFHQCGAQNNPVLENVPDVGVTYFNGKYYLAGVNTNGGFYISNDLVKWEGPIHVFSMNNKWTKGKPFGDNQIHAVDLRYWNGKFHFYWSVNYWGGENTTVHVGHAVADNILGPYVEPDKENWFDDRIDPRLFIDDSAFYFYTVKFTDGNTIWGQRLSDPSTHTGLPKLLFNSLPGTWERLDNNVTEGPEVIEYRSRYYLMYNANHTGNNYGNYALGVAEASDPLGFNSGNKYPHPVVQTNLTDDRSQLLSLFGSSSEGFSNWKYTLNPPGDRWTMPGFPDVQWKTGSKGFGTEVLQGSRRLHPQTIWHSNNIWIRKNFSLPWNPPGELQLLVDHAGPSEVFIDGKLVYKTIAPNYTTIKLPPQIADELKSGEHLLAIHSEPGNRGAHIDVDVIAPQTENGDDILYNPGQANLLKGPNGFEWWLVYFAIKNGERKGQFVSRVFFNDKELTVDGPTGSKTQGYHPDPGLPVFGDNFDDSSLKQLRERWSVLSGKWNIKKGELEQEMILGKSMALVKSHRTTNYLFKVGVKGNTPGSSNAGIIAYYEDSSNFIEIGLDQNRAVWYCRLMEKGKEKIVVNRLSALFNFNVYHSLSIYKNVKSIEVQIDDQPAPGTHGYTTSLSGGGLPGIFTQASLASFDGAIYTPGWDEYNSSIGGWEHFASDTSNGNVTEEGLSFFPSEKGFSVYKGDLLDSYEFATQIYFKDFSQGRCVAGTYPVYVNADNFLKTAIDIAADKVWITGKLNGQTIPEKSVALKRYMVRYPDQRYSDHSMKVYTFKRNTSLTALEFVKSPYEGNGFKLNLFDSLKLEYLNAGKWKPLKFEKSSTGLPFIDRIQFDAISADAMRITSAGRNPRLPVYKMYTDEEQTSDYNLRAVKLKDKVLVFLDGKLIAEIKGSWPPSKVGLSGKNTAVTYNGIMLFER